MYVAAWLDNYDEDFGCYRAFPVRRECEEYLADVVFERAKFLDVPVLDLTRTVAGPGGRRVRRRLDRLGVLRRIRRHGMFELAIRMQEDGVTPVDRVTVAVREAEYAG